MNRHDFDGPYRDECRAHFETRLKYHETLRMLRDLVAATHGDGGHRAESFESLESAVDDAMLTAQDLHDIKEKYDTLTKT